MTHLKTTALILTATAIATLSPLTAQAMDAKIAEMNKFETVAEMNARTLDALLLQMEFVETPQASLSTYEDGEYYPVSEQPIALNISGPIKFSVMEEILLQRFENNINDRGPRTSSAPSVQSLDSSTYVRSTVAAAGISLPF
ncbi:hypothetical protein [Litorimonas sp. WD9-15]|uniref:hypothetical protein n=1 Tax=Litorimonas sp. WD9-15 TaxID=3418716 RepID=UPI003CFFE26F